MSDKTHVEHNESASTLIARWSEMKEAAPDVA
jgi:hypothetical protein